MPDFRGLHPRYAGRTGGSVFLTEMAAVGTVDPMTKKKAPAETVDGRERDKSLEHNETKKSLDRRGGRILAKY